MRFLAIFAAIALYGLESVSASTLAARQVNAACTGAGARPGVCIPTGQCSSGGGTSIVGACPGTPANIRCCTKASCANGGSCQWTNQCSGTTQSGLCPGPTNFQCCLAGTGTSPNPGGPGVGPFPPPRIPSVGACQLSAVNGARALVAQFPGKVREMGCKRDCPCPSNSEHCCGLAIDYMCSPAAGVSFFWILVPRPTSPRPNADHRGFPGVRQVRTEEGRVMAEWMMNNRAVLNLKYVIWGQKIWNPSRDAVRPWSAWRQMENRGDNTQNHW